MGPITPFGPRVAYGRLKASNSCILNTQVACHICKQKYLCESIYRIEQNHFSSCLKPQNLTEIKPCVGKYTESERIILRPYCCELLRTETFTSHSNVFCCNTFFSHNLYSPSAGTAHSIWQPAAGWTVRGSKPGCGKKLFSSPEPSTRSTRILWVPGFFPKEKTAGSWNLTAYLHLVTGPRMNCVKFLLLLYVFVKKKMINLIYLYLHVSFCFKMYQTVLFE